MNADLRIELLKFRRRNNLTQSDVAKKLNSSRSFVSIFECGIRGISDIQKYKLKKMLGMVTPPLNSIGCKLKEKRLYDNLSLKDLGKKIKIGRETLGNFENNKGKYHPDTIYKIANYLGTNVSSTNLKKNKSYGDVLHNLRINRNLTIEILRKLLKISNRTIVYAEKSKNLCINSVLKLTNFYRVSIDSLFDFRD